MEQYTNLPGFFVEMADDGLQIMPTVSLTDSVLLIGTAEDGPEFTPVRVARLEEADAIFGKFEVNGIHSGVSLLLGARQAFGFGCRDIRLVRIPHGTKAHRVLKDDDDKALLKATAFSYGETYNNIMIEISDEEEEEEKVGSIIKIWNRTDTSNPLGDNPTEKFYTKGKTLQALVAEMNQKARSSEVVFYLDESATAEADADNIKATDGAVALGVDDGADSAKGTSYALGDSYAVGEGGPETLRSQLAKAYNYLSDYAATVVVPLDVYYDPENNGMDATALAEFCADANVKDSRVIGIIAAKPLEGNADIPAIRNYVNMLTDSDSFTNTYPGPNGEDYGKFISVVVGQPIFYNNKLGLHTDTAAAAYAGLIATLPPHSSTTNKILSGTRGLKYKFYPAQLDSLTRKRFVTLRQRAAGVAVTDGITAARELSDFSRLSTMRIANAVIDGIKQVTEPFIGEALDSSRQQAIETAIESILADLKSAGALEAYRFGVYFASSADRIRGILTVEVAIVPAFEVRRIRLKITLKPTM